MLQLQHLLAAVHAALISTAFFFFFSYGQSTFLQCYSLALQKRLFSGSVTLCLRGWGGGGGETLQFTTISVHKDPVYHVFLRLVMKYTADKFNLDFLITIISEEDNHY